MSYPAITRSLSEMQDNNSRLTSSQFNTLSILCEFIVPEDDKSCSAREAGVPEFLEFLCQKNDQYMLQVSSGLSWIERYCIERYSRSFHVFDRELQITVLDQIATAPRNGAPKELMPGITFFAALRRDVLSAFFTSKVGITDLEYQGNVRLSSPPTCPSIQAREKDQDVVQRQRDLKIR